MKPQGSNLNKLGSKYSSAPILYNEELSKMDATDIKVGQLLHSQHVRFTLPADMRCHIGNIAHMTLHISNIAVISAILLI
jgi:hypothetical protein